MFALTVVQLIHVTCDHCGVRANKDGESTFDALLAAMKQGFVVSEWMHEETCARQTMFCSKCAKALSGAKPKAKGPKDDAG